MHGKLKLNTNSFLRNISEEQNMEIDLDIPPTTQLNAKVKSIVCSLRSFFPTCWLICLKILTRNSCSCEMCQRSKMTG